MDHPRASPFGRRAFLGVIASAPLGVLAQPERRKKRPQVGIAVISMTLADYKSGRRGYWKVIESELRQRGWIDGENVQYHLRSAEGDWSRVSGIIRELVSIPVDVLLAYATAVDAAVEQTRTIPIVAQVHWDRIGGEVPPNLTGVNLVPSQPLHGKVLSLLKTLSPGISRVGMVGDARVVDPVTQQGVVMAAKLGITLVLVPIHSILRPESDLDAAREKGVDALLVQQYPGSQHPEYQVPVHEWARRARLPAIYQSPGAADTGGLIMYGIDYEAFTRRLAYLIDRILRGAKPSDLPIEDPSKFELVINLSTAKALGITVPAPLMIEATRLVQ